MPTQVFSPTEFDAASASLNSTITALEIQTLSLRSIAAKSTAYCPYSDFHVGSSVLTETGEFVDGANVENASYPVGTCAERVALGRAVTSGFMKFKAIGVATDISPPASPCGMCRHIREFCELETPILMFDKDGAFVIMTIGELLPMSFGPQALSPHLPRPAQL